MIVRLGGGRSTECFDAEEELAVNDPQLSMTFFYLLAILGFGYFCVAQGIFGRFADLKRSLAKVGRQRESGLPGPASHRASR